ncbi:RagB/SusD family nutrient uptake outer membrane protein [Chitinophaga caseinilytica]|uniref:RagB/SusD family nutrient uptake outer membrane protein n=1 Tax=Chitinophaga caseinilytica TaxID=2267521 RepID=A0ABZ2Z9U5_9BACT
MKKHTLSTIVIFLFLALSTSCSKDWFDIKADKNQTIPSTLDDLELLLDDYNTISANTPALGEVSSDGHHLLESTWPNYLIDFPDYNNSTNAYTWSYKQPYTAVVDWNQAYRKIFICNLVLVNIEKIDRGLHNAVQYDRIKGNALFIIAKTYFEIAQLYAEPYKASTISKFGLPIREGIDITIKSQRAGVKETYERIENAIKSAIPLLPTKPSLATRASKNSCYALLSRFYLLTGNYGLCVKYSDSSLSINNKLLDFNSLPIGRLGIGIFNPEVIFHSAMLTIPMLSISDSYIDTSLYNDYAENDLRKSVFFQEVDSGYIFIGDYSNDGEKFSGIANDEILLNRAEAYARLNNIQLALMDVNNLLKTRFRTDENGHSTYQPFEIDNQKDAIDLIVTERHKELIYRGIRWSDLRRLKDDALHAPKIERTIGGQVYRLSHSYQYTLPLPEDEMSFSSLEQNPGWSN